MTDDLTLYILEDFINSLDLSVKVLSHSDDGTNTAMVVSNTYHCREGLQVDIDGTNYPVISVDYDTNTITVTGVIVDPLVLTVPTPFFFHGTLRKMNNELNEVLFIEEKVPMFYLHEVIEEEVINPNFSDKDRISDIRLFLMDKSPENGDTTSNQYRNIIVPLNRLARHFELELFNSTKFADMKSLKKRVEIEWGIYSDNKGHLKRFLDANLTGIAYLMRLPILKCCK